MTPEDGSADHHRLTRGNAPVVASRPTMPRWEVSVAAGALSCGNMMIGLAAGHGDDQVVGVVVRCLEVDVVDAVADDHGQPSEGFVAVDQGWLTKSDSSRRRP